jgi:hypothetical protein
MPVVTRLNQQNLPTADISHSEKPRKHSIAKPSCCPSKAHGDQKGLPISGQRKFTDSSLILIEFTCAGVTELPSVNTRAIVD